MKIKKLLFLGLFLSTIFISESYSSGSAYQDSFYFNCIKLDPTKLNGGIQSMNFYLDDNSNGSFLRSYTIVGSYNYPAPNKTLAKFINGITADQWALGYYLTFNFIVADTGEEVYASEIRNASTSNKIDVYLAIYDNNQNRVAFEKINNDYTDSAGPNGFANPHNVYRIFLDHNCTGYSNTDNWPNKITDALYGNLNPCFIFCSSDAGMKRLMNKILSFPVGGTYKLTAKEQVKSAGLYFDFFNGITSYPVPLSKAQIAAINGAKNTVQVSYKVANAAVTISVAVDNGKAIPGKAASLTAMSTKNQDSSVPVSSFASLSKTHFIYRTDNMVHAKDVQCASTFNFIKIAKGVPVALQKEYPSQVGPAVQVQTYQLAPVVTDQKNKKVIIPAESVESAGVEVVYADKSTHFEPFSDDIMNVINNGNLGVKINMTGSDYAWAVQAMTSSVKKTMTFTLNGKQLVDTYFIYKTTNMLTPKKVAFTNFAFDFTYTNSKNPFGAQFVYGQKDFPSTRLGTHGVTYQLAPSKTVSKSGRHITVGGEQITHFGVAFRYKDSIGNTQLTYPIVLSDNHIKVLNNATSAVTVSAKTSGLAEGSNGIVSFKNNKGMRFFADLAQPLYVAVGNDLSKQGKDLASGTFLPGAVAVIQTTNTMTAKTYPFDTTFKLVQSPNADVQLVINSDDFPSKSVGVKKYSYEVSGHIVKDEYGHSKLAETIDELGLLFASGAGSDIQISYPVKFGQRVLDDINRAILSASETAVAKGMYAKSVYLSVKVQNGNARLSVGSTPGASDISSPGSIQIHKSKNNQGLEQGDYVYSGYKPTGCACVFKTTNMTYPKTSQFPVTGSFEFKCGMYNTLFKGNPDFRPTFKSLSIEDAESIIKGVTGQGSKAATYALKSAGYTANDWTFVILPALKQVYGDSSASQGLINNIKYQLGVKDKTVIPVSKSGATQIIIDPNNYMDYESTAKALCDAGFKQADWDSLVAPAINSNYGVGSTALKGIEDLFIKCIGGGSGSDSRKGSKNPEPNDNPPPSSGGDLKALNSAISSATTKWNLVPKIKALPDFINGRYSKAQVVKAVASSGFRAYKNYVIASLYPQS